MSAVFVQLRCKPGTTYEVADAIYEKEIVSEMYSTSGEYDLLLKLYIPKGEDVGKYINAMILDIPNIDRSLTTLTFQAF
ncbi:MAG: Lrp/AsnC ligand binding domain-containing protein [Pseudomonadota bacterium]